jgi:hypothetical protein
MDNDTELQDSQEPDEQVTDVTEPTLEDYQKLSHKNKAIFARAKKAEERAKKAEDALKAKSEPAPKESVDTDSKVMERLDRIDLKTEGYNDEEIDFLMKLGGKKALEDKRVKAGIDVLRQQAKAENATVDSDSAKSDIEKKHTPDQLKNMSVAELEKILPKA